MLFWEKKNSSNLNHTHFQSSCIKFDYARALFSPIGFGLASMWVDLFVLPWYVVEP